MRTAKYNDYRIFRIVLLIILVIIGLFAYKKFVKAPCEHTAAGNTWITVDATCTEDGYRYKVCSECGEQFDNQVLSALGHRLNNTVITIEEPTCTKTGTGYKACSVCNEQLEFVEIPMVQHTYGEAVIENEVEHTLTQGASFEKVVYCTECDTELSRQKVDVEHTVTETISRVTDPDCINAGTDKRVVYCKECQKALETEIIEVEALGHNFEWTLAYNDGDFILSGVCTADECGHIYDPSVDTTYSYEVEHSHNTACTDPTCVNGCCVYVANVYNNGVKVGSATATNVIDAVNNHTIRTEDGQIVDILEFAQYDENGNIYFNISTYGITLVFDRAEGQTITEAMAEAWEKALRENGGYAEGVFKCAVCDGWINVRVYNDLA